MEQDITFTMEFEGKLQTCTVLFTFYSDVTQAHYMLYTPDDPQAGGQTRLIAARYDPGNLSSLEALRDDRDRAIVQSFIEYISSHSAEEIASDSEKAADTVH